ncbi:hypothetical protein [Thalassobacterium maritimum]|nr:hypothetical protein [Coraliomargarita sp. SDUM461003]
MPRRIPELAHSTSPAGSMDWDIPFPEPAIAKNEYDNGHVAKKSRLGGLLNFYHCQAA